MRQEGSTVASQRVGKNLNYTYSELGQGNGK